MIRYEIEKLLIEGSISTKDIAALWNELYLKNLGVTVPDDLKGFLQDIHWSHGSFGYFATYSTGSLYAAQFYAAIKKQNPDTEKNIESGNNGEILQWLRATIHSKGRSYTSEELCKAATGEYLNPSYFINYAISKFKTIYSA